MDGRVVEHCHTTVGSLATDALVREILKLIGKVTKDFANIIMNENFCINNSDVTTTRKIYKKNQFYKCPWYFESFKVCNCYG